MSVPVEMTVVEIAAPGGPEQLKPVQTRRCRSPAMAKCWCASRLPE